MKPAGRRAPLELVKDALQNVASQNPRDIQQWIKDNHCEDIPLGLISAYKSQLLSVGLGSFKLKPGHLYKNSAGLKVLLDDKRLAQGINSHVFYGVILIPEDDFFEMRGLWRADGSSDFSQPIVSVWDGE